MRRLELTALLLLGGFAAALIAAPRGEAAPGPAQTAPPAGMRAAAPESAPVTLQLRETPLRMALEQLFQGTGLQHAVEPAVPDYPITLSLRGVSFQTALRTLTRLAPGVTYRKEGQIYVVGMRPPVSAPAPDVAVPQPAVETAAEAGGERVERIPLNFIHPAVLAYILNGKLVPTEDQIYGSAGSYGSGLNGAGVGGGYGSFGGGLGAAGLGGYAGGALNGGNPGYGFNPGASYGSGGLNAYLNPAGNSAILAPRTRRY